MPNSNTFKPRNQLIVSVPTGRRMTSDCIFDPTIKDVWPADARFVQRVDPATGEFVGDAFMMEKELFEAFFEPATPSE